MYIEYRSDQKKDKELKKTMFYYQVLYSISYFPLSI